VRIKRALLLEMLKALIILLFIGAFVMVGVKQGNHDEESLRAENDSLRSALSDCKVERIYWIKQATK